MHALIPSSSETVPAGHSLQEVAPPDIWYLPSAQGVQEDAAVSKLAWVPAGHVEHDK
jgi:hypothetical protein